MGRDSRKTQRRQKKRQQRKREQQRAHGNPYRVIGAPTTTPLACYINNHWDEEGMASIMVLKRLPSGAAGRARSVAEVHSAVR